MKMISRFITISILAAAIILPFFFKMDNGKPTLAMPTSADLIPDKILPDSLTGNESSSSTTSSSSSNKVSFYKWQDATGMWHYGDRPPAGAQNVSTMNVNTNVNIIQSVKIESDEESTSAYAPQPKMSETLADGQLTADDAFNAMSDAKAVRDMMESRNETLKAITGEN
ncbi:MULTISPECIES: DUF4124 domain-containing protein [unclassified Oleiphilus]|jgi:hypothetical protein|uniref:DUF4124 domain-containing protein n=2 Tax=Oleiphilus TaxID=141450 RepID=UPI0007C3B1A4|nr:MULTISPECIES: DUF4124 domain-containing protein [unclassified Oleiphilus]KZY42228.1 hypothetical protein A3732_02585 [Oleiphilus sp. HI0050]KZY78382.1 hypothetical protein A3740_07725 [Oleiphilus sp. HI0068]KZY87646.1 hypothetical protein A3741_01915 [Oleiphilus sp. HI0069]KZY92397.1 hypothetical protein A3743_06575 [Oleiphilus sp. HI0072]KZZ19567.1 hypothetical protein A3752_14095 [Oleiphilus sp. HI0081]KZZ32697.1 hypothetical protein A3755_09255 [Oleiphilus sp. HI0085]